MADPAASTVKRVSGPLLARLHGTSGLFSPAIRTKPPNGSQLIE